MMRAAQWLDYWNGDVRESYADDEAISVTYSGLPPTAFLFPDSHYWYVLWQYAGFGKVVMPPAPGLG